MSHPSWYHPGAKYCYRTGGYGKRGGHVRLGRNTNNQAVTNTYNEANNTDKRSEHIFNSLEQLSLFVLCQQSSCITFLGRWFQSDLGRNGEPTANFTAHSLPTAKQTNKQTNRQNNYKETNKLLKQTLKQIT